MAIIIAYCPLESLRSLSLANRSFNDACNPTLWWSVRLPISKNGTAFINEARKAICRDSQRALCIRRLVYVLVDDLHLRWSGSDTSQPTSMSAKYNLMLILKATINLEDINMGSGDDPSLSLCGALESATYSFQLKSLTIGCLTYGFHTFLATQKSLKCLRITVQGEVVTQKWPRTPDFLPELESVHGLWKIIADIIPGKPIRHVHVHGWAYPMGDPPPLARSMVQSTNVVHHIGLGDKIYLGGDFLPKLLDTLPGVTSLSISTDTLSPHFDISGHEFPNFQTLVHGLHYSHRWCLVVSNRKPGMKL